MSRRPIPRTCPVCKKRKVRPYYWSFDGASGKCVVWQCQKCGALLECMTNRIETVGRDINVTIGS